MALRQGKDVLRAPSGHSSLTISPPRPATRPSFSTLAGSLESLMGGEGRRRYEEMVSALMERLPLCQRGGLETPLPPYSQAEAYIQMTERRDGGGYISLQDLNTK